MWLFIVVKTGGTALALLSADLLIYYPPALLIHADHARSTQDYAECGTVGEYLTDEEYSVLNRRIPVTVPPQYRVEY